ncbi:MAG: ADP-ribosylglycohydrolase family protein [Kofleriaceae bacterium]|nr:ADP-ribosylglycohydrolase family protein [Kofleriaceae bacterium]
MEPLAAARASLVGLAVGDAFGAMLDGFGPDFARRAAVRLISRFRPWRWTDDTAMALSIFEQLAERGTIDPDALAAAFVARFAEDPERGYGAGAYSLLSRVRLGGSWREEARALFRGKGSYGNGAAMRAAPIGAYFAPDLERVRDEALRSAEPTHAHPDGAAGAVAVAIAAALARTRAVPRDAMLTEVIRWTPDGQTRERLRRADQLGLGFDVQLAGEELGTGSNITSQDTVPFSIWVAARHLDSYEEAMWTATAHPGIELATNPLALFAVDRDTVGAIVGGIVACATGIDGIPILWREATEKLPVTASRA